MWIFTIMYELDMCNTQPSLGWKLFIANLIFYVSGKSYQNIFHEVWQVIANYYSVFSSLRQVGSYLVPRAMGPKQESLVLMPGEISHSHTSPLYHVKTSWFIYFRDGCNNVRWWNTFLKALGEQGLHLAVFKNVLPDNLKKRSWKTKCSHLFNK